ncbi:cell division protein FtsQ [[Clostridium] symbiosum]|uniref:cell division protein FtsQ/DivIB n=1 Tax=Clostridium symbiosum TaxID=1512 RepID=UPI001D06BB8E|nr:cell division protein FtsQ [[Clostridium] symbiosum]MCB6607624.1 cell division protein FtsQ [[Clostridium] symbiosum]MCB6929301.1 cell division protein FtsQ [[Clostridium] symbiosum]
MRRVNKNRKKLVIAGIFLAVLLLLAVLLSVRIKTVKVSGNERYTQEQIESMLFDTKLSRNPVYCYYQYRFRPHKSIPFVEDYKIVFRSPVNVEIITYEKSVVGYVSYMNSLMYFDKDGIIVESTNEKLAGIPMITGLRFGHIVLHKPLPVEDVRIFDEILNLTQVLEMYDIKADRIDFNSQKEATLTVDNLKVELGGNAQINGKISELRDILNTYTELSGTLYLDTYDETNSNPSYRFEQDE